MSLSTKLRTIYHDLLHRRTRTVVAPPPQDSDEVDRPIFLIGLYRSGTTLVRYIVDSHSSICCPPESPFLQYWGQLLQDERSMTGLRDMGYSREHTLAQLARSSSYFYRGFASGKQKARWADKSPALAEDPVFLGELFPEAQFVVLYRPALDQIHSFTRGGELVPDVIKGRVAPGEDVRVVAARYWVEGVARMRQLVSLYPDRAFVSDYLSLCAEPEARLRRLFEFLGEPWEPQVLNYHEYDHDFGYEDNKARASRGFKASSGSWRAWDPNVIAAVQAIVSDSEQAIAVEWGVGQ